MYKKSIKKTVCLLSFAATLSWACWSQLLISCKVPSIDGKGGELMASDYYVINLSISPVLWMQKPLSLLLLYLKRHWLEEIQQHSSKWEGNSCTGSSFNILFAHIQSYYFDLSVETIHTITQATYLRFVRGLKYQFILASLRALWASINGTHNCFDSCCFCSERQFTVITIS